MAEEKQPSEMSGKNFFLTQYQSSKEWPVRHKFHVQQPPAKAVSVIRYIVHFLMREYSLAFLAFFELKDSHTFPQRLYSGAYELPSGEPAKRYSKSDWQNRFKSLDRAFVFRQKSIELQHKGLLRIDYSPVDEIEYLYPYQQDKGITGFIFLSIYQNYDRFLQHRQYQERSLETLGSYMSYLPRNQSKEIVFLDLFQRVYERVKKTTQVMLGNGEPVTLTRIQFQSFSEYLFHMGERSYRSILSELRQYFQQRIKQRDQLYVLSPREFLLVSPQCDANVIYKRFPQRYIEARGLILAMRVMPLTITRSVDDIDSKLTKLYQHS